MFGKTQHVKPIGGDIMGGRTEGQQPQEGQRKPEKIMRRQGQRHTTQTRPDQQLHRDNPASLGPEDIDKRDSRTA